MADHLRLSLWFPGFAPDEMLPRLAEVLRCFPFSEARPGIHYASVQPLNWGEPSVLEEGFDPGDGIDAAITALDEYAQSDYALTVEAWWDLWVLDLDSHEWILRQEKVSFTAQGAEFDDGAFAESGHILINFGLDFPFLHEGLELNDEDSLRVKANVAALIEFTHRVEQRTHTTGRVLWTDSEENLAQKLIARLQQVQ